MKSLLVSLFAYIKFILNGGMHLCRRAIHCDGRVFCLGSPIIELHDDATIRLGAGVTLNSRNRGYHLNMYTPVKLVADRPGAMISIGSKTRIHGTCIHACSSITIGKRCLIAANCQIIDNNGHCLAFDNVESRIGSRGTCHPVTIDDDVWIGANCFILPGVRIGKGAVISANSVVIDDIPPCSLARGNPAVVIPSPSARTRSPAEYLSE